MSPPKTLTVTNNTKYQVAFTSISAETGFSVASTNCGVLPPGQACTVQIVFVPMHTGNCVSRLNLGTPYSPGRVHRSAVWLRPVTTAGALRWSPP